jgi:hypothetical protein
LNDNRLEIGRQNCRPSITDPEHGAK